MTSGLWFVAPKSQWTKGRITFDADESHHALKVLRVAPPDIITVTDGRRSVVRWDDGKKGRLEQRWQSIARSAAKQSRNPWMIRTGAPLVWAELVARIESEPLAIVLWEEASLPLRTALIESADRVALVVGPEGGLEHSEANVLADAGAQL